MQSVSLIKASSLSRLLDGAVGADAAGDVASKKTETVYVPSMKRQLFIDGFLSSPSSFSSSPGWRTRSVASFHSLMNAPVE